MQVTHQSRASRRALVILFAVSVVFNSLQAQALNARERAAVQQELGLRAFSTTELELPPNPGERLELAFQESGRSRRMILQRHSLLAADFKLIVQDGAGRYSAVEIPQLQTYRGYLQDDAGSVVTASIRRQGLFAVIHRPGETVYLEPLSRALPGAATGAHLLYRRADVVEEEFGCEADESLRVPAAPGEFAALPAPAPAGDCASKECRLAIDCDYEYFQRNASSVDECLADAAMVMNEIDWIYYRDTGISYTLSAFVVRTDPQNPFTDITGAQDLLFALRDEWNANFQATSRDVAHLFSGKNRETSTIGVAYIGVICSSGFGYGMSHTFFSANLARRAGVTAHELGHNWNANHCSGDDCNIMCPSIGGCSGMITQFSSGEIGVITQYRDTRACLADSNRGPALPFPPYAVDDFAAGANTGAIAVNVLDNDDDPNCADLLRVLQFDAATAQGGTVTISAARSPLGLDQLIYTPPPEYSGGDSFQYTVGDGSGMMDIGSVSVDVIDAPDELTLKLVDYLLGLTSLSPPEMIAGDMDQDGAITIADVIARRN